MDIADDRDRGSILSQKNHLLELDKTSRSFGRSISGAFASGIVEGKRFEDVLRSVGKSLATHSLRAAFKPIELAVSQSFGDLFKSLAKPIGDALAGAAAGVSMPVVASAMGNVVDGQGVRPFAQGGVVASPTYFPLGRGVGLMGERGAEAIMPLARGPDGKLGVRGAGGAGGAVNLTVNIETPDVEGFRRSEAAVAGALARIVGRGRRAL